MKQSELLKHIAGLTPYQRRELEMFMIDALKLNEEDKNTRPEICPYCKKKTVMIKKGFKAGKQRYQCKECSHVFSFNSHTITMYSKIEISMFKKIILDTLSFVPIKQTAANLNLSIPCIFENRHKVLCALEELLRTEVSVLSGTIEFDETYELECKKGGRNINRKARHRGGTSNYRGLSREQICIVTATDRNGHEIFKAVGYGTPTANSILENFSGRLAAKSVIYSDGAECYNKLIEESKCDRVILPSPEVYNKVEHINTVNCIHSIIKTQMTKFRGVATKYMNRYMSLFVFVRRFQEMDDNELMPIILRKLKTLHFNITRNGLKNHNLVRI